MLAPGGRAAGERPRSASPVCARWGLYGSRSMSNVAVIAKLVAAEGKADDLVSALEGVLPSAESETGTLVYALHRDQSDPNTLWMYELYADMGALAAHSSSEALAGLMGAMGGLLAEPPVLTLLSPIAAKGLALSS